MKEDQIPPGTEDLVFVYLIGKTAQLASSDNAATSGQTQNQGFVPFHG